MNGSLTAEVAELRSQLGRLDDAGQRVMVQELVIHTHAALNSHIKEHEATLMKVNEMHTALFDPENGLVSIKKWLCRIARAAAAIAVVLWTVGLGLIQVGNKIGWW